MLEVAKIVLEKGFVQLKAAFEIVSPQVRYRSLNAKRKLLQLPLAAIAVGTPSKGTHRVFLVEKQNHVKYTILQSLLNQWWKSQTSEPSCALTRNTVTNLLKLAESGAEKKRMKYAIVSATGLSNKKAAAMYGFTSMSPTVSEVEEVLKESTAIRKVIEKLAELKDKELLKSLGITDENSCESDSSDESETDNDDADISDVDSVEGNRNNDGESSGQDTWHPNAKGTGVEIPLRHDNTSWETGEHSMDPEQLLVILRQCNLNWFEFTTQLKEETQNPDENILEPMLEHFFETLPNLDISEHDLHMIQQARDAYQLKKSLHEKQDEIDDGMIVSELESDDPEEFLLVRDPLDDAGKKLIMKKRAAIHTKAKREIKKKVAEKRFLMRRRSKKVGKILRECPDIGKTIEKYVEKCGVGADAWRRTGIYTFDGNTRQEKKVTFKRIQDHLESTYGRTFSHGTVVQLCVARNKRRKSAARYKGLAQVVQRRARKGFTIKYNPDVHWSAALYRGLDDIQYTDGSNIMNFGPDDQSGFRLDTMSTNKQHATLCLRDKPPLTTCVDYVNRYPSVLQTTSYNFPSTKTTGEICVGVVKAQKLFPKNPAQHFADLLMVEEKSEVKPAFINHTTGKEKDIECVRVDGAGDEGPLHEEVQYWWTKRHFQKGNRAMLISARNSGSSYQNRVELQNGCLSLGHANVFIPSTLHGSCIENGEVNDEILFKNLDTAIDVYISRVDQAPCAETVIHLWKGADSKSYQEERKAVNTFLKGKKDEKQHLQEEKPELLRYIQMIWGLRAKHMTPNLPNQYLFFLQCCYEKDCVHRLCQTGVKERELWYPHGPSISYLPLPTPDPTRPYGNSQCKECSGFCAGHYMKPEQLVNHVGDDGKVVGNTKPPSQVILESFKTNKGIPNDRIVETLSKQVLLPIDEVMMWLKHLKNVQQNRAKGAQKAAATRKKNKNANIVNEDVESNQEDVCYACRQDEPPDTEELGTETITWIGCETCARWFHTLCVDMTETVPDEWCCPVCCDVK